MNRMMMTAVMALFVSATGCGVEGTSAQDGTLEAGDIGQQESPVWVGHTSEELAPINCEQGYVVNGIECTGSYCDNVRVNCTDAGVTHGTSYWTSAFSEEPTNSRTCNTGEWVTGIACSGGYCDSVSLECTAIAGKTHSDCKWSGFIWSGTGPFQAPTGYYVRGAQCRDWWCEDMAFFYCKMS